MVQLTRQSGDHRMKNDRRETVEPDTFFEKLEKATPTQLSQAIIAKIMLKLNLGVAYGNVLEPFSMYIPLQLVISFWSTRQSSNVII